MCVYLCMLYLVDLCFELVSNYFTCLFFFFFPCSPIINSAVHLADQHINFRSLTPAKQSESINLKASKSMDLGKKGWGDIQVSFLALAHLHHVCFLLLFLKHKHQGLSSAEEVR